MTNPCVHINATSGDVEYYTPPIIVEAARKVLGDFDLDPASSLAANRWVKASQIYTAASNGLAWPWRGRIWLNHPFGKSEKACKPVCRKKACLERGHITEDKPGNEDWINKLVSEYRSGNVQAACCITFASTSESWFRPLHKFAQCYLIPRTNYLRADGTIAKGVSKGSVVTYMGDGVIQFGEVFRAHGEVKIPFL